MQGFERMALMKWMRNLVSGGDAGRTQVAVEYNGPVVRTPGRSRFKTYIAVLLSSSYCVNPPKMTWGLPNLGMSLDICSEPLRKDSKVEILF